MFRRNPQEPGQKAFLDKYGLPHPGTQLTEGDPYYWFVWWRHVDGLCGVVRVWYQRGLWLMEYCISIELEPNFTLQLQFYLHNFLVFYPIHLLFYLQLSCSTPDVHLAHTPLHFFLFDFNLSPLSHNTPSLLCSTHHS